MRLQLIAGGDWHPASTIAVAESKSPAYAPTPPNPGIMVPKRFDNPTLAELKEVERRLLAGEEVVAQFREPGYGDELLDEVNSLAARFGRSLEVRFYSHVGTTFDCAVLNRLPAVVHLSIDCLQYASNLDAIAQLGCLETLSIGIDELSDTRILRHPNLRSLTALTLGASKSKAIDLSFLGDYSQVKRLRICGHTRGIETLAAMTSLRTLALDGIGKQTRLDFLSKMTDLQSLRFLLGGRLSISEIDIPELRDLEVCRVRGLTDLGDLSRFRRLESLIVDDQAQIEGVALSVVHSELRMIRIFNCRTLREVSGLDTLPKLDHLVIGETTLGREALLALTLPPSIKVCSLCTGKEREDRLIDAAVASRGYGRS